MIGSQGTGPAEVPRTSSRTLAVGVMLLLVLVAALAGAAIDRLLLREEYGSGFPVGPLAEAPSPATGDGFFDEFLTGNLALTAEQRHLIDSTIMAQISDYEQVRLSVQPQLDSILGTFKSKIDAILTAEQQAALPLYPPNRGRGPAPPGLPSGPPPTPPQPDR